MAKFQCDGIELDIDDSGSLSVIQGWIKDRDEKIKSLEAQLKKDSESYMIGETEYCDMKSMYKDFKKLMSDYNDMKSKCDELMGKQKDAKAKCDALEAELATRNDSISKDDFTSRLKERRKLERIATIHLDGVTEEKLDSLDDRQIMEEIINSRWSFDDLESRSDSEIKAMFEVATKDAEVSKKNYDSAKQTLNVPPRQEHHLDGIEYYTNTENAWKHTLVK